ncbi:MAG: hypothetical protein VX213_01150, partial [Chloroflexota bacterium]|nr:hypothetical protein [Chloroflexota bacterium]
DEQGFIVSDNLLPQKARILLMLGLTISKDRHELQQMFYDYSVCTFCSLIDKPAKLKTTAFVRLATGVYSATHASAEVSNHGDLPGRMRIIG